MSRYFVNDNSLISVADAIRSKTNTSEELIFPTDFITAIKSINTGSGSDTVVLQTKTGIVPTESNQTITADNGYDGLSSVQINAISNTYIGSSVPRRTQDDFIIDGPDITAPAGYYNNQIIKTVASGVAGTPTAMKGAVNNHSIDIIPSVTNITGYIEGDTINGVAINVSANELVSGTKSITANGIEIDVTNYADVTVNVQPSLQAKTSIIPSTSSQTITADSNYDGLSSVQINAMPSGSAATPQTIITANPSISVNASGLITVSVSGSQNITPSVTAGYVSSGTSGTVSVNGSNTEQLTTQGTMIYNTSITDQTIASGKYLTGTQTIKAVTTSGLTASNIAAGVNVKVGDANDDDRIANVTGTYTSDATAIASDIVNGETAYANGSKVTGTLVINHYYTGSSDPSSSLGNNGDIYLKVVN